MGFLNSAIFIDKNSKWYGIGAITHCGGKCNTVITGNQHGKVNRVIF
jgi:hypothetical protein